MLKILYVHGYNGNANGSSSQLLKEVLTDRGIDCEIYAPEFPLTNPKETFEKLFKEEAGVDVIVASSLGAFYTMQMPGAFKILINPALPENLRNIITDNDEFIDELEKLANKFFTVYIDSEYRCETDLILGLNDDVAPNSEFMKKHFYSNNIHEVEMGHKLNEEGANVIADIIKNTYEI